MQNYVWMIVIDLVLGLAVIYMWRRQNQLIRDQNHLVKKGELLTRKMSSLNKVETCYIEFKNPGGWQGNNKARLLSSLGQARLIFIDKKIVDAIIEITDDTTWLRGPTQGSWDEVERIISLMKNDVAKNTGSI